MEDASSLRPVSVYTRRVKEAIALLEQEMVRNQFLSVFLAHGRQRVVVTCEVIFETLGCLDNFLLDLESLLTREAGLKRVALEVAGNSDAR